MYAQALSWGDAFSLALSFVLAAVGLWLIRGAKTEQMREIWDRKWKLAAPAAADLSVAEAPTSAGDDAQTMQWNDWLTIFWLIRFVTGIFIRMHNYAILILCTCAFQNPFFLKKFWKAVFLKMICNRIVYHEYFFRRSVFVCATLLNRLKCIKIAYCA